MLSVALIPILKNLLSVNIASFSSGIKKWLIITIKIVIYNENENSPKSQIIDFLFKCLDKFGREASILFSFVDFRKENTEYLNRLLFRLKMKLI